MLWWTETRDAAQLPRMTPQPRHSVKRNPAISHGGRRQSGKSTGQGEQGRTLPQLLNDSPSVGLSVPTLTTSIFRAQQRWTGGVGMSLSRLWVQEAG